MHVAISGCHDKVGFITPGLLLYMTHVVGWGFGLWGYGGHRFIKVTHSDGYMI